MIRELSWIASLMFRSESEEDIKDSLLGHLESSAVPLRALVPKFCAMYHTEHLLISKLNKWDTIVVVEGFTTMSELTDMILNYERQQLFVQRDGWCRSWAKIWYNPTFRLFS